MAISVDGVPVSGSSGNKTFSRNRYGAYIRRRVMPTNPNSSKQNNARNSFRAAVAAWGSILSSVQRAQWRNWADTTPWLNAAGQNVNLTGQAAWIRSASAFLAAGFTLSGARLSPPVQNDVGSIDVANAAGTIAYEPTTGEFSDGVFQAPALTNSSGVTNGNFLVEVTPGLNAGVTYPGSRWSSMQVAGLSNFPWAAGVINIDGITPDLPWGYQVGQFLYFRFRGIGENDSDPERRVTTQTIVGPIEILAAG